MVLKKRKEVRLKNYDYSQSGAYFLTICTHERLCFLGDVVENSSRPNQMGEIAINCWNDLPKHYLGIKVDAFVVMPNHIHGIVLLDVASVGAGLRPARAPLSEIVRAFKSFSARRINELRKTLSVPVWQRGYYEHIVRDEEELNKIREYIVNNPLQWAMDEENPERKRQAGLRPAPTTK